MKYIWNHHQPCTYLSEKFSGCISCITFMFNRSFRLFIISKQTMCHAFVKLRNFPATVGFMAPHGLFARLPGTSTLLRQSIESQSMTAVSIFVRFVSSTAFLCALLFPLQLIVLIFPHLEIPSAISIVISKILYGSSNNVRSEWQEVSGSMWSSSYQGIFGFSRKF